MYKYEIHFCEGEYFMAKIVDTEQSIIDNTFTEHIGNCLADNEGIINILQMLNKAYKLQIDYPIEK